MTFLKGSHAVPILALSAATFISAAGCSPTYSWTRDPQTTERMDCVKKVDPSDTREDATVEVVDPSFCQRRSGSSGSVAGGLAGYFIARHLMGQVNPGTRFGMQPPSAGGQPLIPAGDDNARTRAGIPSTFSGGKSTGRTVSGKSGGLGGKTSSGGS